HLFDLGGISNASNDGRSARQYSAPTRTNDPDQSDPSYPDLLAGLCPRGSRDVYGCNRRVLGQWGQFLPAGHQMGDGDPKFSFLVRGLYGIIYWLDYRRVGR